MRNNESTPADDIQAEYDFSEGIRGKHAQVYRQEHRVKITKKDGSTECHFFTQEDGSIMLDPDVKQHFPDAKSVNTALRSLLDSQ